MTVQYSKPRVWFSTPEQEKKTQINVNLSVNALYPSIYFQTKT